MIDRLVWIWVVQVIFVYCMWVVLGVVIIAVIVSSVAVGPVIHEPKTRPSLSRVQLTKRFLLHHGSFQTGSPSSSCQQQVACCWFKWWVPGDVVSRSFMEQDYQ